MSLQEKIKKVARELSVDVKEQGGFFSFKKVIAERRIFIFRRKLMYVGKMEIDDEQKKVYFTEMLKETGFGSGSMGMASGVGFKVETYKTKAGSREGVIEEQSRLFGKRYDYEFDFSDFRKKMKDIALEGGYEFIYKII